MKPWTRSSLATALGLGLALTSPAVLAPSAQAAITPTASDRDGDGLPDAWETNGVDTNGDGTVDLNLPALGANPDRADLFVELDWMPGLLPSAAELDSIKSTFAQTPITNPDGSTGISIHLDAGSARGAAYNLGGGNELPYKQKLSGVDEVGTLRAQYSNPARAKVFHYAVFGDAYGSGSSSGQAHINGLNLLITVGPTYWTNATSSTRVGTFIHELGHNLNLLHGGSDNENYKPGYLSVMNYAYQLGGVPRTGAAPVFWYSRLATPTLNEASLTETAGIGSAAAGYDLYWWRNGVKKQAAAGSGIDWNGDGALSSSPLNLDINKSGSTSSLTGPNDLSLMKLDVGVKGDSYAGFSQRSAPSTSNTPEVSTNELTAETAQEINPEQFTR